MEDAIISVRIPREVHEKMKQLEYIRWSAIIRNALKQHIHHAEQKIEKEFDKKKARQAAADMDRIRKSGIFDGGKTSVEIIREWRDKRRF